MLYSLSIPAFFFAHGEMRTQNLHFLSVSFPLSGIEILKWWEKKKDEYRYFKSSSLLLGSSFLFPASSFFSPALHFLFRSFESSGVGKRKWEGKEGRAREAVFNSLSPFPSLASVLRVFFSFSDCFRQQMEKKKARRRNPSFFFFLIHHLLLLLPPNSNPTVLSFFHRSWRLVGWSVYIIEMMKEVVEKEVGEFQDWALGTEDPRRTIGLMGLNEHEVTSIIKVLRVKIAENSYCPWVYQDCFNSPVGWGLTKEECRMMHQPSVLPSPNQLLFVPLSWPPNKNQLFHLSLHSGCLFSSSLPFLLSLSESRRQWLSPPFLPPFFLWSFQ